MQCHLLGYFPVFLTDKLIMDQVISNISNFYKYSIVLLKNILIQALNFQRQNITFCEKVAILVVFPQIPSFHQHFEPFSPSSIFPPYRNITHPYNSNINPYMSYCGKVSIWSEATLYMERSNSLWSEATLHGAKRLPIQKERTKNQIIFMILVAKFETYQ